MRIGTSSLAIQPMHWLCLLSFIFVSSAYAEPWQWLEDNWIVSAEVVDGQTFTMKMRQPITGESATAEGEIIRSGDTFVVRRRKSTDTNHRDCDYRAKFESDGRRFVGTYTCTGAADTKAFGGAALKPGHVPQKWRWLEDNWIVEAFGVVDGPPFLMVMLKPNTSERARAQGVMALNGNAFTIVRTLSTDSNHRDCNYSGSLDTSSSKFSGTYSCTGGINAGFAGNVMSSYAP
jgi:hypothetical protein